MTKSAIACSFAFALALSLAAGSAEAQWFGQKNNEETSDLTIRVQKLEAELRELSGRNAELEHQNQMLTQQLSTSRGPQPQSQPPMGRAQGGPPPSGPMGGPGMTQGSITEPPLAQPRAQQQYGGPPPAQPPYGDQQYGAPPQADARSGRRGDAFDPNANPNAPGAPRQLGAPMDMGAIANRPGNAPGGPYDAPQGAPYGGPQDAPPPIVDRAPQQQMAVLPPSNSAKDEYDLAYGYILRRDYALADQTFRVFLQSHPDDRLVPDASYWLGESQYQRQSYNDAAETFLDVYNKYPNSPKAPDSLLRLGQSLAAIGKQEAACASLGAVLKKYPKASPQVKNQVNAEQKRVRC
jgi:tol-pal system protein YbgF